MNNCPRTDALASDPLNSNDTRAWQTLAGELEKRLRDQEQFIGTMRTKLARAQNTRDEATDRAHKLRLEAKGYHHSLMRCERDAKRWQYWRKRGLDVQPAPVYKAEADAYTDELLDGRRKP